jgi:Tol biopolymer transport system component
MRSNACIAGLGTLACVLIVATASAQDSGSTKLGAVAVAGSAHSSGSNGKIAFDRDCSIFVMSPDGSAQRRLTHPKRGCDREPVWSPDGSRVAFSRSYDDPSLGSTDPVPGEIYVMRGNGAGLRRITRRAGDVGTPRWSPDGTAVAFDQQQGGASIASPKGIWQRVLAPGLTWGGGFSWSPSGNRIAIGRTSGFPLRGAISVVDPNGRMPREELAAGVGQYYWPAWSRAGR